MAKVAKEKPLSKLLQVILTEDAFLRIKVEAAKKETSPGRVVSNLAVEHLPAVDAA